MFNGKNALVIGVSAAFAGAATWAIYEVGSYIKEKRTLDDVKEKIAEIDEKVKKTVDKVNLKTEENEEEK